MRPARSAFCLGGVLTSGLSWKWVLWVNVPVTLIAFALAPRLVPESRSEWTARHFDAAGAVTITGGISVLAYALLDAGTAGWGSTKTIALLALAVALIAAFVVIEQRSKAPLVPLRIFRSRTLTGANVVGLLLGASLFSMFFFITLYMQQVLHYSPIHAGLSYLPLALMIIVAAGARWAVRDPVWLQADPRGGHGGRRGRTALVQQDLGHGWQLLERYPRPVTAGRRSGSDSGSSPPRSAPSRE